MVRITRIPGDDPRIRPLLEAHAAFCAATAPEESCHFLEPDALVAEDLLVWAALDGDTALGVAALRVAPDMGEVKSMHTRAAARGQKIAQRLLTTLIAEAEDRAIPTLRLETGSMAEFAPARALYETAGFTLCPPFGSYVPDPNSVFYEKHLSGGTTS